MRLTALVALITSLAVAHADERTSPEARAKFVAELRMWAQTYYPALVNANRLPNNITLGFLVDPQGAIHEHSVGFRDPSSATVPDELAQLFPKYPKSAFRVHGAGCFGGLPSNEPRYCVVFARVQKP